MREAKHTPEPWTVSEMNKYIDEVVIQIEDCRQVFHRLDVEDVTVLVDATPDEPETHAVVKLLLAAPELLDACKLTLDAWHAKDSNFERELNKGTPEWLSSVRAAIAKTAA